MSNVIDETKLSETTINNASDYSQQQSNSKSKSGELEKNGRGSSHSNKLEIREK